AASACRSATIISRTMPTRSTSGPNIALISNRFSRSPASTTPTLARNACSISKCASRARTTRLSRVKTWRAPPPGCPAAGPHSARGIDWDAFLTAAQLGNQQRFAAYHAHAITGLSALVASQPLQAWKDWLAFHQINSHADVLPSAIDHASFAFYGTTLSGTPQ